MFFVISDFLITEILIRSKESSPYMSLFLNFYIRRILRITPIYYIVVIGMALHFCYNNKGIITKKLSNRFMIHLRKMS